MRKFILIAASSLFMFGCGNEATEESNQEAVQEEHHHNHDEIQLNNGAKWKVDDNMMVYIQHMDDDIKNFVGETLEDNLTLAKHLNENIEGLTSDCTMEGKAHDELHKWLIPYITLVEEYAACNTVEDAVDKYDEIVSSFEKFHKYFE